MLSAEQPTSPRLVAIPRVDSFPMMNRHITWAFFALLLVRYGLHWAPLAIDRPESEFGAVRLTLIFAGFSLAHAIDLLGWRRAVTSF